MIFTPFLSVIITGLRGFFFLYMNMPDLYIFVTFHFKKDHVPGSLLI